MSKAEIARNNFMLASKFTNFVVKNPKVVDGLPADAQVVFISGSAFLKKYNLELGKSICKTGARVFKAIEKKNNWTLVELGC
ncbi:hypothetical protein A3C96_03040 [Candidatus Uhrbacteria bacterium RIFCSPHIGHO2_02_FULL_60_10]|uniref:Uncharacterized protein n=1 Tax=Candidatus Uhrbacteria bacterium RIFCSPHIGHO2_02_FULL_60_10 TaxID=1802392 RepID=A0A1F7U9K6_9BACT|nr:MAG: hypothetical protein A3C96_03040 [Candidatus Uhrbacteria bacterium RIFCSPHIGHO2_02_FULL_60_10]